MKKLTVKDVAKEAGVSTATISRVLNNTGYVSEHAREQVLRTIKMLNYQPNSIARSLKQKKSSSIGIVLPDMTNPYFMSISRQIQRKCMSEGYHLLYMDTEEDPEKERQALDFLLEKRVEALIIAGTGQNKDKIESAGQLGVHVILIDRKIENLRLDVIAEDNRSVSEEAVSYLLNKGHRHIGIINGPMAVITAKERYEGAEAAFAKFGARPDARYVYEGDFTRQSGAEGVKHLMRLPAPPTAIFSANNEMSYGLYLGLHELGIRTNEIEVVSFGDLEFSPLFSQKLSVIMQNPQEIGDAAADLVLKRLELGGKGFENRLFYPRMIQKH